jgi:hypothetical protein
MFLWRSFRHSAAAPKWGGEPKRLNVESLGVEREAIYCDEDVQFPLLSIFASAIASGLSNCCRLPWQPPASMSGLDQSRWCYITE